MKDIVIYGAGGFGKEIACVLKRINDIEPQWNFLGFIDDTMSPGTTNSYGTILGGEDFLNHYSKPINVCIAIGSAHSLSTVVSKIKNPLVQFPNIIDPSVLFVDKESVKIGKGNILYVHTTISCNVTIGDFNILNGSVGVGHDAVIGNYNVLMPNVNISGNVRIGERNTFGLKSSVIQRIGIGNDVTVGAHSFIMRRPKDGQLYMGVPATIVKI